MYSIGIDIGGTNTRVAVVKNGTEIIKKESFATYTDNPQKNIEQIAKIIKDFNQEDLVGIGLSCPGPADLKKGIILTPQNLPGWHGYKIVEELEKLTNLKTTLENDANLAALGEYAIGAGVGHEVVQFFTASTGLGAGLVIDGKIIQGQHGFAQEVANVILEPNGFNYGIFNPGALEANCSGTGIINKYNHLTGENIDNAKYVFDGYKQGNEMAIKVIEEAEEMFANMIAASIAFVDPGVVVISGSVALYNPDYIAMVAKRVETKVMAPINEYINIVVSELDGDSGLIGAGYLGLHNKK